MSFSVAILGLAALVLIHEAGHFFVARAVGMTPRKFYLGFGPALIKTRRNGVEYGIAAFPLGGYVKIPGMHRAAPGDLTKSLTPERQEQLREPLAELDAALARDDEDSARAQLPQLREHLAKDRIFQELEGSLSADAYWRQRTWKRVAVIAAGPGINVLVALALFVVLYMVGPIVGSRFVDHPLPKTPAAAAGVRPGDEIVSIRGHAVGADDLPTAISATHGKPFTMVVLRDGRRVTLGPLAARKDQGAYRIGIAIRGVGGAGESFPSAVGSSFRLIGNVSSATVSGLVGLAGGKGTHDVSSTVGIVRDTSAAYKQSLRDFFGVLGLISLALALLNLIPVLPLDGGHIAMSIIEGIRGRAFSQLAYMRYSAVGLSLFLFLMYLGLRNDLFSGGS
jgi:regulator of sigma E protease